MIVLLIEDNQGDQELTKIALSRSALDVTLRIANDGVEAMDMLAKELPDLILLDLNLPRPENGGLGVLRAIKQNGPTKLVPVIVLTTSNQDQDIWAAYEHWVNAYLVKPFDVFEFYDLADSIVDFWLVRNQFPKVSGDDSG